MPTLNYSNPLHTFSSGYLSYTAIKDCYLLGSIEEQQVGPGSNTINVKINNNNVYTVSSSVGSGLSLIESAHISIPLTKLSAGDIVTVNVPCTSLSVFEEL